MIPIEFNVKAVVFNDEGKFLTMKRVYTNQKWDLPGGKVEIPEIHEAALRREIREEAGLDVENIKPIDFQTIQGDNGGYLIFAGFRCVALGDEVNLSHEHSDYKWVSKEEFLAMEATQYLKEFVEKL